MSRLTQFFLSAAIVVIGALVVWGRTLSGPGTFKPLLFAAPVALGALAYQALLHPWLAREGAGPFAWLLWTIVVPLVFVVASLILARPFVPALAALLTP
jgi:hypothetical protein